jgi:hypothetical protein
LLLDVKNVPHFHSVHLRPSLGDQQKEDEVDVSPMTSAHDRDDIWEDKTAAADDHLDKMDDLEKNNNEESWGHWTDEEYLDEVFEYDPICKRCGKGKEGHKVIAVMARKFADCISNPIHGTDLPPES